MHTTAVNADVKILYQAPVWEHGLRPHPGAPMIKINGSDRWNQLLQRAAEFAAADGSADFIPAHFRVSEQKLPQPRIGECFRQINRINVLPCVTFSRQGENGVGSSFDPPMYQAGEMYAQKREGRIRTG